jgi:hypothetical protein
MMVCGEIPIRISLDTHLSRKKWRRKFSFFLAWGICVFAGVFAKNGVQNVVF